METPIFNDFEARRQQADLRLSLERLGEASKLLDAWQTRGFAIPHGTHFDLVAGVIELTGACQTLSNIASNVSNPPGHKTSDASQAPEPKQPDAPPRSVTPTPSPN